MRFRNLTPHDVVVANGELKLRITKKPEDPVVRIVENVHTSRVHYKLAEDVTAVVPLKMHAGYSVHGLPEPEEGVILIVSSMVASRVRRIDVVSPITDATCERGEDGHVVSVKGFQTYDPGYGHKPMAPSEPEMDFEDEDTVEAEQETGEPDVQMEAAAAVDMPTAAELIEGTVDMPTAAELIEAVEASVMIPKTEGITEDIPVEKVNMDMLDPLKAAEAHMKKMKYLKRIGKYQKPGKRR